MASKKIAQPTTTSNTRERRRLERILDLLDELVDELEDAPASESIDTCLAGLERAIEEYRERTGVGRG